MNMHGPQRLRFLTMSAAFLIAIAAVSVVELQTKEDAASAPAVRMTPAPLMRSQPLNALRQPQATCPIIVAQQCTVENR
jgi:hypothetical protein